LDKNIKSTSTLKSFEKNFWVVILMEFFERGSYYGVMSVFSVYLVMDVAGGGLGFSKESVGIMKSVTTPLLYFLPILGGAIADRFGYKKVLVFAFFTMSIGYLLMGFSSTYNLIFASLVVTVLGAGVFKPIISGTIARTTNESNSTLGFGIYYWAINLGAFLFPLILIPILRNISYNYIFFMAAIGTGWLFFLNIFVYKEPAKLQANKPLKTVFKEMLLVLTDVKFILLIVIYSGFWVLYFQMYDAVLWYFKEYINMAPLNNAVNSFLGIFVNNPGWKFEEEHVTVINAGVIILLQILVSNIVKNTKPLPTMITGIAFGTVGMAILGISNSPWVFITGIIIFTFGEMIAHPKFISYIGLIAPEDKKALYLGYSFLYGVIGSSIAGVLGAYMYVYFITNRHNPSAFWLIFSGIGLLTIFGLLFYAKIFKVKEPEAKS
jgi:Dipeptide/tripeptide permease